MLRLVRVSTGCFVMVEELLTRVSDSTGCFILVEESMTGISSSYVFDKFIVDVCKTIPFVCWSVIHGLLVTWDLTLWLGGHVL